MNIFRHIILLFLINSIHSFTIDSTTIQLVDRLSNMPIKNIRVTAFLETDYVEKYLHIFPKFDPVLTRIRLIEDSFTNDRGYFMLPKKRLWLDLYERAREIILLVNLDLKGIEKHNRVDSLSSFIPQWNYFESVDQEYLCNPDSNYQGYLFRIFISSPNSPCSPPFLKYNTKCITIKNAKQPIIIELMKMVY